MANAGGTGCHGLQVRTYLAVDTMPASVTTMVHKLGEAAHGQLTEPQSKQVLSFRPEPAHRPMSMQLCLFKGRLCSKGHRSPPGPALGDSLLGLSLGSWTPLRYLPSHVSSKHAHARELYRHAIL